MMALNLVVKGSRFDATRAAAQRGIPFVFETQLDHETVGKTSGEFFPNVIDWFLEDDGKTCHNGSLLLYSEDG